MSVKGIFGKFFGKKSPSGDDTQAIDATHHEIASSNTVTEKNYRDPGLEPETATSHHLPEIELYIQSEKIKVYQLAGTTRVGRDPAQCDIAIPELIVSKSHCTLLFREDGVYVEDNKSTNGTYINGRQILEPTRLEDHNLISLGKKGTIRIVFHARGES